MATVSEINLKQPNERLVKQLRRLLKHAEQGEIVGMAGAVYYHDGATSEHWVQPPRSYNFNVIGDRFIGCLERVKFMLLSQRLGVNMEEFEPYDGEDDD